MAVAYQSVQSSGWSAGATADFNVTKPVSLAAGDLMLCHYATQGDDVIASLSGWTLHGTWNTSGGSGFTQGVLWKIADSADAAAASFTFALAQAGSPAFVASKASISRLTGSAQSPITASAYNSSSGTSHTYANSITPGQNNILFMFIGERDDVTASGYAIATSNPTWTEIVEQTTTTADDYGFSLAVSSVRASSAATGSSSATLSGTASAGCVLLAIRPDISSSTSESVTLSEAYSTMTVYTAVIQEAVLLAETLASSAGKWMSAAKSALGTWTNTPKQ